MSLIGVMGGVMAVSNIVKTFAYKKTSQYKAQVERDKRLQEFQKRQQKENQLFQTERDAQQQAFQIQRDAEQRHFQMEMEANRIAFQIQRDAEQRHFQMEMEANRMAFQERIEMRRLQVQEQLEKNRAELTIALNEKNIENSKEIAEFNARAMRETQILVARENAQNLLQDRMVQDALKNFPLNISPLVLLKNRPHSLASLLRFTVGENCNMADVVSDVMSYVENPEALNVFVAPVYVDSKIKNRKILSKQIWDTIYQQLESFFTTHYNRRSKRPVIFYPTAWNDKYSPGMHASETLHFFLRDMPCVVLEPRFDGNNFRIMVSTWGLGYTSNEHVRTELNFEINIDAILAYSVYERSKIALRVLNDLIKADIVETQKKPYFMQRQILELNIKLYESLRIEERISNNQMNELDALGIYKIFNIEPVQDLALLSEALSAQIGMTLASLTDIHHLRSTGVEPLLPALMKNEKMFSKLFMNVDLCNRIFNNYRSVFLNLLKEEKELLTPEDRLLLTRVRDTQLREIKTNLNLNNKSSKDDVEQQIREYCKARFKFESENFEKVWYWCLDHMEKKDKPFFELLLPQIEDDVMWKQLKKKLINLV